MSSSRETELEVLAGPLALQRVVAELRSYTGASRATIRLGGRATCFPVVAEARRGPQVPSLMGLPVLGLATFQSIVRDPRILVQEDVSQDAPAVPELRTAYGVAAQMIAPVVQCEKIVALISVHVAEGPRQWSQSDRNALVSAQAQVSEFVDASRGA